MINLNKYYDIWIMRHFLFGPLLTRAQQITLTTKRENCLIASYVRKPEFMGVKLRKVASTVGK